MIKIMNDNKMKYESSEFVPARLRLMIQEDFVRAFYKHVVSTLNVYESAVARNDYQTAETMQKVLRQELVNAIDVIDGNTERWGINNSFVKVGGQQRQLLNEKGEL